MYMYVHVHHVQMYVNVYHVQYMCVCVHVCYMGLLIQDTRKDPLSNTMCVYLIN